MRVIPQVLSLSLLLCLSCSAQEIPRLPSDGRTMPDAVVYRILMHHAATFDQKAQELEAKGLDGSPYRKHFEQKLGLSSSQVAILMQIAREYLVANEQYERQITEVLKKFNDEHMPGGVLPPGEVPPPPPAAVARIREERNSAVLGARDKFRAAIGDVDFARADAALRTAFGQSRKAPPGR